MNEQIMELVVFIAPLVAGFISSVVIPIISSVKSVKYIKRKTDEVSSNRELREIKEKLNNVEKQVYILRGKKHE